MNICIICDDYPNKKSSTFAFVKQLVDEWACLGHHCYVISPYSVTKYRCFNKVVDKKDNPSGGSVTLIRPNYISFSSFRLFNVTLTSLFYKYALKKAFSLLPIIPDVVYGHFWGKAYCGYEFAKKHHIPLFVASGESSIARVSGYCLNDKDFHDYIAGAICVSTKNKQESIQLGLASEDKCIVVPNAVNNEVFFLQDKVQCRKKWRFPQKAFIVAFVGWFNQRKGSRRLAEAINLIDDDNVYSIFIGNGPEEPNCKNILFKGNVKHENICSLLNCADVFVLPTLQEGCCNAIIEAMACGLPVISSDRSFNWDILNGENSIMIDPESVGEIADAIRMLKNDGKFRDCMAKNATESARLLDIHTRAQKIISFMEEKMKNGVRQ